MNRTELRRAIDQRGLTVTRAAQVLGVSRVYLSYMLNGQRPIPEGQSARIAVRLQSYDNGASNGAHQNS